jgi:type VI secretion system protein ImpF
MNKSSKSSTSNRFNEDLPRPSLFDRLTDESVQVMNYSLNQTLEAIRRDLENLINTPRLPMNIGNDFKEIQTSILNFGIYDISSISGRDRIVWTSVFSDIEKTIATYEPRLKNVKVNLSQMKIGKRSQVEFEIHGELNLRSGPNLVFQSTIEFNTGRTLVDFPDFNDSVH